MADIFHQWGTDLVIGPTGDIGTIDGSAWGQQRLLTNPGDYIWQLDYGAGLARFIGQPASPLQIRAIIRSQIFKEASVARQPEPLINVQISPGSTSDMWTPKAAKLGYFPSRYQAESNATPASYIQHTR